MERLQKALLDTHGVELDPGDQIEIVGGYCSPTIVDILVTDVYTGQVHVFECYDSARGVFPY